MAFKREFGDWTQYRKLPSVVEVDFHQSEDAPRELPYWEAMGEIRGIAFEALKAAQKAGDRYVLFTHGWSTSRRGKTTARSEVRSLMRSPAATPYIVRRECIQHDSVFVAAVRLAEELER